MLSLTVTQNPNNFLHSQAYLLCLSLILVIHVRLVSLHATKHAPIQETIARSNKEANAMQNPIVKQN